MKTVGPCEHEIAALAWMCERDWSVSTTEAVAANLRSVRRARCRAVRAGECWLAEVLVNLEERMEQIIKFRAELERRRQQ
jgi:hypothetical protein